MQDKVTPEHQSITKKYPSSSKVFGACVLCAVCTVLASFSLLFLAVGAALSAWIISASKRPAVSAVIPVVCAFTLWFFTAEIYVAFVTAFSVYVIGLLAAVGIRTKASFWLSSVICSVGAGLYSCASFLYMIYNWNIERGGTDPIVTAIVMWWNEITATAVDSFTKTFESAQLGVEVTPDMIEQLVSGTTVLLPGALAAVFVAVGAVIFVIGSAMHSLFGTEKSCRVKKKDPLVGLHTAIFFIITVLVAALISAFKNTELVQFTLINMAIAMFVPLFVTGITILIRRIKAPRELIKTPDGRVIAAPRRLFILWLIIPLAFFNIFMGMTFVAFFGAVERINSEIFIALKKKAEGEGGSDNRM